MRYVNGVVLRDPSRLFSCAFCEKLSDVPVFHLGTQGAVDNDDDIVLPNAFGQRCDDTFATLDACACYCDPHWRKLTWRPDEKPWSG